MAAIRYTSDHILDYIELDDSNSIFEVEVPKPWLGHSIGELDIRKKHSVNVMALKKDGKMNISVTPDVVLTEDMSLLVLGEYKSLRKCFNL